MPLRVELTTAQFDLEYRTDDLQRVIVARPQQCILGDWEIGRAHV